MADVLRPFSTWIRKTDRHAAQRLDLVHQAGRLISDGEADGAETRQALAERLERWRYQLLNERAGHLAPTEDALCAALDLTANELSGRQPRPPRSARAAIHDESLDCGAIAEGMACLEQNAAVDVVSRRAAELTREHFGLEAISIPTTLTPCPWCASGRGEQLVALTPCSWCGSGRGEQLRRNRQMLLYAPIYLSNYCINHCTYCGFRHRNPIGRKHLVAAEVLREATILGDRGYRHLLLVAGEFPSLTSAAYYAQILRMLTAEGFEPAIEIAPQTTAVYAELHAAGACGIALYQETYNAELYAAYHPRGSKRSYDGRLEGLERAAEAGLARLGLGILLGLADPREDLLALMRHGSYLKSRFPDRTLSFSLPRIHDAPAGFLAPHPVDDDMFLRMYCALRVAFPSAMLVLSTREPPALRNRLANICITQMSAGSSTAPGGYQAPHRHEAGEQFPVCDHRTADEVARWLEQSGFRVAWSLDAVVP